MNVQAIAISMLPEHLLLAGIVLLIALEIVSGKSRFALALSMAAVGGACAAALALAAAGFAATPFPGHFSVDPAALLGKATVLALAMPALLISRADFGGRQFHILVLSSLYGACVLLAPTASSRSSSASSSLAPGVRAGPARLSPAAERRGGVEVPRPGRRRRAPPC
jgi:NADH-quinone oxidoreductase subunit N